LNPFRTITDDKMAALFSLSEKQKALAEDLQN
jgi:hypothetical protein